MTLRQIDAANDRGRRRWIQCGVVAGAALLLPTTKARALGGLSPEIKAIKDKARLVVGMASFSSPPFFDGTKRDVDLSDGANSRGWDVDLARHLAQTLDVEVVFDRRWTSFNAVIDAVAAGQVDLGISKLSATAERAVGVLFSRSVITPRHALLINRLSLAKRAGVEDPRSVINRGFDGKVGVIARSSYVNIVRTVLGKADLQEFPSWDAVISAVEEGRVDLAYRDEIEIKKIVRLRSDLRLSLKSAIITDFRDSIAVALPPGSQQLQNIVDVVIDNGPMMSVDQLLDKYIS